MSEKKGFLLRVPKSLLEELRAWAEDDMRSLNAQIEYLLRRALREEKKRVPRDEKVDGGDGAGAA